MSSRMCFLLSPSSLYHMEGLPRKMRLVTPLPRNATTVCAKNRGSHRLYSNTCGVGEYQKRPFGALLARFVKPPSGVNISLLGGSYHLNRHIKRRQHA